MMRWLQQTAVGAAGRLPGWQVEKVLGTAVSTAGYCREGTHSREENLVLYLATVVPMCGDEGASLE